MTNSGIAIGAKHSILDSEELLTKVVPLFAINGANSCEFWWMGNNDTYKVSIDSGEFALRVYQYDWRNQEEIRFELESLLHLKSKGIHVSSPVPLKKGGYVTSISAPEGNRWSIMTSFVKGEQPQFDQGDDAFNFGKQVAKMHSASQDFSPTVTGRKLDLDHLLFEPMKLIRWFLANHESKLEFLEDHAQKLAEAIKANQDKLDWGYCHGDLFGENAKLDQGKFSFFDFDFCGMGYRAYDLATFKASLMILLGNIQQWPEFLSGYQSVRPLSKEDLEMIDVFLAIFMICRDSRGIERFKNSHVGKDLLSDRNIERSFQAHKMAAALINK